MEVISGDRDNRSLRALTRRQRECMLLVQQGLSSKQIARELGISHRTVEQHVASALETLGVKTRMAAVAMLFAIEREDQPGPGEQGFMLRTPGHRQEIHARHAMPASADIPRPAAGAASDGTRKPTALPILPPLGGKPNTANSAQRNAWIARIAVLAIMLTGVLILSILGVSEMAGEVGP